MEPGAWYLLLAMVMAIPPWGYFIKSQPAKTIGTVVQIIGFVIIVMIFINTLKG